MSAGREFQVDGAATEKARRARFGVHARNDEHRKSAEPEVVHGSVPGRRNTLDTSSAVFYYCYFSFRSFTTAYN